MNWTIGHGMQLEVTGQDLMTVATDFDLKDLSEKSGFVNLSGKFLGVQGNHVRIHFIAVYNRWDPAPATHCPSHPLAGPITRLGGNRSKFCHFILLNFCLGLQGCQSQLSGADHTRRKPVDLKR